MNTMIIGIAGGTGSGKTTLTDHLAAHFGSAISVVHHDNYYKRQDVPFEERCKQNYDHPDAFDTGLMVSQLKELKAGRPIRCPVYSYADHNRTEETVLIQPAPVIIVEGILIFHDPPPAGADGYSHLRGDGRGCADSASGPAGCGGAGPLHAVRCAAVSDHGEAHA